MNIIRCFPLLRKNLPAFLLIICLGFLIGLARAQEVLPTDSIKLIPLPVNQPLQLHSADNASLQTINDPWIAEFAEQLREVLRDHEAAVEAGEGLATFQSWLHPAAEKPRRPSATPPVTPSNRKYLPPEFRRLAQDPPAARKSLPRRSPSLSLSGRAERLDIELNAVGTPRQIQGPVINDRRDILYPPVKTSAVFAADARDTQTVAAFLNDYRNYLRLDEPPAELTLTRQWTDGLGRSHLRYAQHYRGIPIWPTSLTVHLDPEGNVESVNGAFIPTPRHLATTPAIGAEQAITTARAHLPDGGRARVSAPELIIHGPVDGLARLAWKVELDISLTSHWTVIVDAVDSTVLTVNSNVWSSSVPGSGVDLFGVTRPLSVWWQGGLYYMRDASKPTTIEILDARKTVNPPFFVVVSYNPNSGWLPDAVSAVFNLSKAYDYFRDRHGRDSFDSNQSEIKAIVQLGDDIANKVFLSNNAFWSAPNKFFGFGYGQPFAGSLDVVAHEFTHAVTTYTANLVYSRESGALNEAFSDIFGEMVENYATGITDWLMGSQLSSTMRSMKNPPSVPLSLPSYCVQYYPSRYSEYCDLCQGIDIDSCEGDRDRDHGGVHINHTIVSHAFYLLADGLSGAVGINAAEKIFYRSLTTHLNSQSKFIDARLAAIKAAEELFGAGSVQAARTAEAFDAVEIFGASPTPTPPPTPPVSGADATLFISGYDLQATRYGLWRRETALGDGQYGKRLSTYPTAYQRPSVSRDGRLAIFVDSLNDLCLIAPDGGAPEQCLGRRGEVFSVAISPDQNRFGFVFLKADGTPDNKIVVIDLATNRSQTFDLVAPTSQGFTVDTVLTADIMSFTANNRYLIYDALNVLRLSDGSQIGTWSISAIDLVSGATLILAPPYPGLDIGNPAIAQTSDNFMTFEAVDASSNQSTIFAANLVTGELNAVDSTFGFSVPAYNGDDTAIIYSKPDASSYLGRSLYKRSLADRLSPVGNSELWLFDADFGVIYRRGTYQTRYALTVGNLGQGRGTVTSNPAGIQCGSTCAANFASGAIVTLTANPASGSTFAGWSGACAGTTSTCQVTMDAAQSVTVTFTTPAATVFQTAAGTISWFYAAAFHRTPIPNSALPNYGDIGGLAFWTQAYLTGAGGWAAYRNNVYAIADFFVGSDEFQAQYPASLTNEQFVTALYDNMLGRAADAGGLAFWVGRLNSGVSRGAVLADFTNSEENRNANPLRRRALESFIAFTDADGDRVITPEEAAVWLAENPNLDGAVVDGN